MQNQLKKSKFNLLKIKTKGTKEKALTWQMLRYNLILVMKYEAVLILSIFSTETRLSCRHWKDQLL